jgi:hypothetical protein
MQKGGSSNAHQWHPAAVLTKLPLLAVQHLQKLQQ